MTTVSENARNPATGRPQGSGNRPSPRDGSQQRRPSRPRYYARRKVCGFCANKVAHVDYKDTDTLMRYVSDQTKIESRRKSGACYKHQRELSRAIKRARHLAMLPMSRTHLTVPTSMPYRRGPR